MHLQVSKSTYRSQKRSQRSQKQIKVSKSTQMSQNSTQRSQICTQMSQKSDYRAQLCVYVQVKSRERSKCVARIMVSAVYLRLGQKQRTVKMCCTHHGLSCVFTFRSKAENGQNVLHASIFASWSQLCVYVKVKSRERSKCVARIMVSAVCLRLGQVKSREQSKSVARSGQNQRKVSKLRRYQE